MASLRVGRFQDIYSRLVELLIAFSMLNSRIYGHAVFLQLSLLEYWAHNGHPVMDLISKNPGIMVGDNIELLNRQLAQHCMSDSRRNYVDLMDQAYLSSWDNVPPWHGDAR